MRNTMDKIDMLLCNPWSANFTFYFGFLSPKTNKPSSLPGNNGLGFDNDQIIAPVLKKFFEHEPEPTIPISDVRFDFAPVNCAQINTKLVSECNVIPNVAYNDVLRAHEMS